MRRKTTIFISWCFLAASSSCAVYKEICTVQEDCKLHYNANYECKNGHCTPPDIFPLHTKTMIAILILIITSAVTNAGILAPGPTTIVVLMFAFDYVAAEAIPLSKSATIAGALVVVFMRLIKT